jgi:cysteine desulfurase
MINASNTNAQSKVYYLDYQATTPCDPRVVEKMIPHFTNNFGNPHSRNHAFGWNAEEAIEVARGQVAHLIGAGPKEIIFTSGATESNNLALKGVVNFYKETKNHIITTVTEHKCVLDTCRHLEEQGFEVTYLPVQSSGLINLEDLRSAITDKTVMVSIMAVHNEIGVIQPLKEIGAICREKGVFFHTDAAQAVGKIPLNVEELHIDLMSISGHKLYGPKGIGALYVRRRPRVRVQAQINGGGQERGMRSGTLPTPLCVGFGDACAIAEKEMAQEHARLKTLYDHFTKTIFDSLTDVYLNGDAAQRFPGNINISFAYVEGEGLMMGLKDLAISSGSACTSASLEPSYVLRALGVGEDLAHTSLRIGFGRFTTLEEVNYAASRIISEVKRLREMSPLWEMAQEGIDITQIKWAEH